MNIFQEYREIALQNGFLFESMEDNKTFITPNDRILNTKYCFLSKNDIIYFASDSYAAKVGMSSTYSGVYTILPNNNSEFEVEITKRFWTDLFAKRNKLNNSFIDKNLTIKTNRVELLSRIIDVRVTENFLKLWKKYPPIKIIIGKDYLPFVASFKGKLIIGIESNEWIMPKKFLTAFNDIQEFLVELKRMVG